MMDERNQKLYSALKIVIDGDHSDDALSALWYAAKAYRQSAPVSGMPSRKKISDTSDISVALRDDDFVALENIFSTWKLE